MILIAGLGNPKRKYKKTRHNIGFRVIDSFKKENNFPKFKIEFNSELSKKGNIILLKPQTFMNNSGTAIKQTVSFYKIPIENIIIVHDDLDIPLGEVKMSENKGSAGHNGVQSIIDHLKTNQFKRLRIGIQPETSIENKKNFVLKKFSKQENIEQAIKKACQMLVALSA